MRRRARPSDDCPSSRPRARFGEVEFEPIDELGAVRLVDAALQPGEQFEALLAGEPRPQADVARHVREVRWTSVVRATSMPLISARPAVGLISPRSSRSVVDLPAPFGPEEAEHLALGDVERQSSSATTDPNRFVNASIRAAMPTISPYEIAYPGGSIDAQQQGETGRAWLKRMLDVYHHAVWLNPTSEERWGYYESIGIVQRLMAAAGIFPLPA